MELTFEKVYTKNYRSFLQKSPIKEKDLFCKRDEDSCAVNGYCYGVATISRLLQMIGLFCKRDL